jgi:hypothetical protein
MDNNNNFNIPYIVFESSQANSERTIKRLIIALVITIILMFATNVFWIYEFCSFDLVETEEATTLNAGTGTANYIGQDGDITYGNDNNEEENTSEDTSERQEQ